MTEYFNHAPKTRHVSESNEMIARVDNINVHNSVARVSGWE
jgi:hypothetical protein